MVWNRIVITDTYLGISETYYFLDCTEYLVDEDDGDGEITLNIKRKGDLSIVQSAST